MKIHEKYIKRCIELAKNGLGTTYPNPLVGSVIVYNNKIVGEGWHRKAGEPHAEVHAINSVTDRSLLKNATIYVSLEPCSHHGKTPPCSDLIIASGIKKVIVGTIDPFAKVSGRGIKKMTEAGCNVTVGILEIECHELNKRFFAFHNQQRPYVILKWAESSDGFISPAQKIKKAPVWITNQYSRQLVHKWRSEEQGILVGTNTVLEDNPKLNTRDWNGSSPVRIVIDRLLKTPKEYAVWDDSIKTIIFTEKDTTGSNYKNTGLEYIDFSQPIAKQIVAALYKHHIQSVIVEGGTKTIQSFIDENVWDEIRMFKGPVFLKEGTPAPQFEGTLVEEQLISNDYLKVYRNK